MISPDHGRLWCSWGAETSNEGKKASYTTSRSQLIFLSRLRFSIGFNLARSLYSVTTVRSENQSSRCKILIIPKPHRQKSPLHSAAALTQPGQPTNHLPPSTSQPIVNNPLTHHPPIFPPSPALHKMTSLPSHIQQRSISPAGNGLSTIKAIDAGEEVLRVERPLVAVLNQGQLIWVCEWCFIWVPEGEGKSKTKLRACQGCRVVRYCSKVGFGEDLRLPLISCVMR